MMTKRLICLYAALAIGLATNSAPAAERQVLHGLLHVENTSLASAGHLPATNRLNLAISLPLRNREILTSLLKEIYDPSSTNYHRFLTAEQFTEMFGPAEEDYAALIQFARTNGFTVTQLHPNRTVLDVSASVPDIEKTLHTRLNLYPHPTESRMFYAPDSEPSLAISAAVLTVSGLDNYSVPHPKNLHQLSANPAVNPGPKTGSAQNGNYIGNDFRMAYAPGVSLTGSGEAVGLVEFDGYYANDITTYESKAGTPSVTLQNVLLDGFSGTPTTGKNSGSSEVSLDIEMSIAMAPGLAKVIVYEAGPSGSALDILNRMATDNQARQLSCSWDFGTISPTSMDQVFQQMAAQGQSFFNACGDNGAYTGTIPAPDDDPYITLVGGTTLTTSGPAGAWVSETVWNWYATGSGSGASGGGISTTYPIPTWQQGINMSLNQGSTSHRNLPDVALTADNVWVSYNNGKSGAFGGTSCAAPLWAGFTALINQQALASSGAPVGFINPALYALAKGSAYSSTFHDITTGNNSPTSGSTRFMAVTGYDLCTGWGTPTGQALIDALAGTPDPLRITPTGGFSAAGPIGGPFNITSEQFFLTNAGTAPVNWTLINTSLWLTASATAGTLTTTQPASNTDISLNAAASSLPAGVYSATISFSNLTSATVQTRQFSLQVGQNLVQNGGFETGDLSSWTLNGTATDNHVVGPASTPTHPELVHSGSYGMLLGEVGALGYLSQNLATTPGQNYLLSFWVSSPYFTSSDSPNEFQVEWSTGNSSTNILFDQSNMAPFNWTNMQFVVRAQGDNTTLQFGARNDPQAFGLDDISVLPVPEPTFRISSQAGSQIMLSWNAVIGQTYQVQYTTDLTQNHWTNLNVPITPTNAIVTSSDFTSPDRQRFYRLVLLP